MFSRYRQQAQVDGLTINQLITQSIKSINQIKSTKSINQPNEQPYARAHGGYTPEIMNVSCVQICHTNVSNDMHYYRQ